MINGVNVPFLVDTVVNNTTNVTNNNTYISGNAGIVLAGISGNQITGTIGFTGLGNVQVSMVTGNGSYGFSGLFQISGKIPLGTYYFVFPGVIDTASNNNIPDIYIDDSSVGYEFVATLKTACQGQSILGAFNKNGSNLFNFEVPTGVTKFTSGINISLISGDVITTLLNQVGNTTAGSTLTTSINVI